MGSMSGLLLVSRRQSPRVHLKARGGVSYLRILSLFTLTGSYIDINHGASVQ